MGSDGHERFQQMIDETLAGTVPEEQSLREHLEACVECQEYLAATNRVIGGLGGFSFAVDPDLNAKVSASLRLRAQQIKATRPGRRQLVLACVLALTLTAAGSFFDLRLSGLIASVFDLQRMQVQHGLIAFWIVPSLCLLLLFPLLPLLSGAGSNQKERNL
jgi:anti-sigma factor RsiW